MAAFAWLDQEQGIIVSDTPGPETAPTAAGRADSQAAPIRPPLPEREPPEGYKALAMDYPFALLLGGLALGAVAGALLPRSATRKLAQGAITAAGVAGELGLAYGRQALEAAGEISDDGREKLGAMGEKLAELGEALSDGAGTCGRKATEVASDAANKTRETGIRIARQIFRLMSQLRH